MVGQAGHGLRAAALRIEGGDLSILAGGDGAHLEAGEGETCFTLAGGQLTANADGRGIYAGGDARIEGGDLRLETEGDGLYVEARFS